MRGIEPERRSSRRAQLLALLCAAGQLAGVAHLTLVRHQACPQHGDLLHGDAAHGVHAAPQAQSDHAAFRAAAAIDGRDEHDHCSVPCERRKQVLPDASHALVSAACGAEPCPSALIQTQHGVEVLSLAPKQSPPAV